MRKRNVTIKYGSFAKSYKIESEGVYDAKMKALAIFLKEFGVPGRPIHYLGKKKHLMDISVSLEFDKRRFRTAIPAPEYNTYLLEQLQQSISRSVNLSVLARNEATSLILRLQEVLQ